MKSSDRLAISGGLAQGVVLSHTHYHLNVGK